ncbi:proline--tRNA ligase [bacterium]|nr:proline--tRNA ligase [bacterium]
MRWTESFISTLWQAPSEAEILSHKLMLRAGLIKKLAAGVYIFMPLGLKVLRKIENIVREEMNASGALELLMPILQPEELWQESGRWEEWSNEMMCVRDHHKRQFGLGPTHEEIVTDIIRKEIKSYKQLPVTFYQIQTKFRDEIRPRFGIIRAREFTMKDAYSFDRDIDGLNKNYKKMRSTYCKIFDKCVLKYQIVEAESGIMGGDVSHEFMALADSGEDVIVLCPSCGYSASMEKAEVLNIKQKTIDKCPKCAGCIEIRKGIELGHIFKLGDKYSKSMGAKFLDKDGREKSIIMGCYGIGISRIIAAVIEQNNDENGIIWPESIAPYQVEILPLNVNDNKTMQIAENLYEKFLSKRIEVIIDDRNERPGIKFKDADLIGIPIRITISSQKAKDNIVEIHKRDTEENKLVDIDELQQFRN